MTLKTSIEDHQIMPERMFDGLDLDVCLTPGIWGIYVANVRLN